MKSAEIASPEVLKNLAVSSTMDWLKARINPSTHMVFLEHEVADGHILEVTVTSRDSGVQRVVRVDLNNHRDDHAEGGLNKVGLHSELLSAVQSLS